MRAQSGGLRQRAWDALRGGGQYPSVAMLASIVGCSPDSLRPYISALVARRYVQRHVDGSIVLIRDTGPRSPSWSVHTDEFRDWNIAPAMSGHELEVIIRKSGLSLSAWLRAHGFAPTNATKLRHMIDGQRPVSDGVAAAAQRDTEK